MFGLVWAVLQPVPLALMLYAVFSGAFREKISEYFVYVICGIVFWSFFQNGIMSAINSLHRNATVLRQLPVQAIVFPLSAAISAGAHLALSLIGLLGVLFLLGLRPSVDLLFLPIAIAIAVVFTAGVGLLLCPLALIFGDLNEAISLILGVLIYATPVFYPVSILPAVLQPIILNSPLAAILTCFREPIQHGALPSWPILANAVVSAGVTFALGWHVFQKYRNRIPFHV